MRLPYAADVLIEQVGEKYKNVKVEPTDDLDGFDVARTLAFEGPAAKYLDKVLPVLLDQRITSVFTEDGKTLVTFSGETVADERDRFALDAAELVEKMDRETLAGKDAEVAK
jgi:hypothetical protein